MTLGWEVHSILANSVSQGVLVRYASKLFVYCLTELESRTTVANQILSDLWQASCEQSQKVNEGMGNLVMHQKPECGNNEGTCRIPLECPCKATC